MNFDIVTVFNCCTVLSAMFAQLVLEELYGDQYEESKILTQFGTFEL